MKITMEPHKELETKTDYHNKSMSLIQRRRRNITDEWMIKVMELDKRECQAIHQDITDNILYRRG